MQGKVQRGTVSRIYANERNIYSAREASGLATHKPRKTSKVTRSSALSRRDDIWQVASHPRWQSQLCHECGGELLLKPSSILCRVAGFNNASFAARQSCVSYAYNRVSPLPPLSLSHSLSLDERLRESRNEPRTALN